MKRRLENPDNQDQPPNKRLVFSNVGQERSRNFVSNPKRWDVTFRVPLKVPSAQENSNNNNDTADDKEDIDLDTGDIGDQGDNDTVYREYPCVKALFAMRSDYFDTLLFDCNDNKVVTLNDVDCETFEFIRDWCYNVCSTIDNRKEFKKNLINILVCAFKYDIKDLLDKSVDFVRNEWIVDYDCLKGFLKETKKFCEDASASRRNTLTKVLPMIFNNNKVIRLWSGANMVTDLGYSLSVDVLECLLKCDSLFMREEFIFELCESVVYNLSKVWIVCSTCQLKNKQTCDSDVRGLDLLFCNGCKRHFCQGCRIEYESKFGVVNHVHNFVKRSECEWKLCQDVAEAEQAVTTRLENGCEPLPMMSRRLTLVDKAESPGKMNCSFCKWGKLRINDQENIHKICQDCEKSGVYLAWKYKQLMSRLVPWIRFENMEMDYFKKYVCEQMKRLGVLGMDRIGDIYDKMLDSASEKDEQNGENEENGESGDKEKRYRYDWKANIIYFDETSATECGQDVELNYKYDQVVWVVPQYVRPGGLQQPVRLYHCRYTGYRLDKARKTITINRTGSVYPLQDVVIYKENIAFRARFRGPGFVTSIRTFGSIDFAPGMCVNARYWKRKGAWTQVKVLELKQKNLKGAAFIRVKTCDAIRNGRNNEASWWIWCHDKDLVKKISYQHDDDIKAL